MRVERIPVVGPLFAAGADDRVFDVLLLLGPLVIVAIAIMGRSWFSMAIALAYTLSFVGYIAYNGLR